MRKSLVHIFAALLLTLSALSCDKPYRTKLDLAVDHDPVKGIKLSSADAGTCTIHITSNASWTASVTVQEGEPWCRLDRTSGSGIAYLILTFDENPDTQPRTALFSVSGSGKTLSFPITQAKAQ